MRPPRTTPMHLRFTPEEDRLIRLVADDLDLTPQWIIRRAVVQYLEHLADRTDVGDALTVAAQTELKKALDSR